MRLTKEQILAMHSELIIEHGGSDVLRDEGLFDSAIATPYQTFGGNELLPTVQQKAVRLGYGFDHEPPVH